MIHALEMTHHMSCTIKYPVVFLGLVKVAFATAHPDGYMSIFHLKLRCWYRSHSPAARQRVATEHWLAKPGVQDGQNAKAHAWMACKQESQTHPSNSGAPLAISSAVNSPNSRNITPEVNDDSILVMEDHLSCSCDLPTLQSIEIMVNLWKKDWQSEDKWNESYGKLLSHARCKGGHWTSIFFEECSIHALEGQALLESIREVVHTSCPCCRESLKYDTIILYDLLSVCIIGSLSAHTTPPDQELVVKAEKCSTCTTAKNSKILVQDEFIL
ncbi:uncharacterized protein BJ212DRAFT_1298257 [Suillus subaureus]|uniref:Uncharacterized protein n=1 Tax=Suillus subaureus TaxID=48587 RepID=A0A9P7JFX0_9AGAM|nr:uncharacterized protein BJ212DRAFT_1298257 [Suillus subaureus]KAG1819864.1 hypothetical protein BJ212DRAFT_1298257 [Suillus subaureus]